MTSRHAAIFLGILCAINTVSSVPVHAQSAEFAFHMFFQGSVLDRACIPSLASSDASQAVATDPRTLPLIAFASAKQASGTQHFAISLQDCTLASQAGASTWFYSTAADAVTHGQLRKVANDGVVWHYQLLPDATDRQIDIGVSPATFPRDAAAIVSASNASVLLRYRVRYTRSAAATIDTPNGDLTHVMNYY